MNLDEDSILTQIRRRSIVIVIQEIYETVNIIIKPEACPRDVYINIPCQVKQFLKVAYSYGFIDINLWHNMYIIHRTFFYDDENRTCLSAWPVMCIWKTAMGRWTGGKWFRILQELLFEAFWFSNGKIEKDHQINCVSARFPRPSIKLM